MRAAIALCALLLAGCGTVTQTQKIPVPVACDAAEPARPVMPTEALQPGVDVDAFVAATQAEIERREGYEGELLAALRSCTAPIAPS